MIITIDGPAAAGKGTLAAKLAQKYKLAYFDTGMVYRATSLQMLLSGLKLEDEDVAEVIAKELTFPKMIELSTHKMFRSAENGQAASIVSVHKKVRAALLKMQQDFSKNPVFADGSKANGAVYDGRDTGTVVCPHANVKFFLTASLEVRTQRRFEELKDKGFDTTYEVLYEDIKKRDERDMSNALKPAADAINFDTSDLDIEGVFQKACEIIDNSQKNS